MSEEKDLKQAEEKKEAPKKQAEQSPEPAKENIPEKKEQPAPPKKEATQKKEPVIIEKPANCMKCNKHLQRKMWYYRNGGYYCSKRCWKSAVQAKAKKKEPEKK